MKSLPARGLRRIHPKSSCRFYSYFSFFYVFVFLEHYILCESVFFTQLIVFQYNMKDKWLTLKKYFDILKTKWREVEESGFQKASRNKEDLCFTVNIITELIPKDG